MLVAWLPLEFENTFVTVSAASTEKEHVSRPSRKLKPNVERTRRILGGFLGPRKSTLGPPPWLNASSDVTVMQKPRFCPQTLKLAQNQPRLKPQSKNRRPGKSTNSRDARLSESPNNPAPRNFHTKPLFRVKDKHPPPSLIQEVAHACQNPAKTSTSAKYETAQ